MSFLFVFLTFVFPFKSQSLAFSLSLSKHACFLHKQHLCLPCAVLHGKCVQRLKTRQIFYAIDWYQWIVWYAIENKTLLNIFDSLCAWWANNSAWIFAIHCKRAAHIRQPHRHPNRVFVRMWWVLYILFKLVITQQDTFKLYKIYHQYLITESDFYSTNFWNYIHHFIIGFVSCCCFVIVYMMHNKFLTSSKFLPIAIQKFCW